MDEAEFSRLLTQFRVVRPSTYCRVAWKADAMPASSITEESPEVPSKKMKVDMNLGLAIETFMQEYFSQSEAHRIRLEFEKSHANLIQQLCLEDVEEMCQQFKQ